jgi:ribose 5-phosphate isomerase B
VYWWRLGSKEALAALEQRAEVLLPAANDHWPEMSQAVAEAVASGDADFGVLMCWTGTGTAMAANKVVGIRADQAFDPWIAANARRWSDANVVTMSLNRTAPSVAVEIVNAFLDVEEPDEDEMENIAKLDGR